MLGEERSASIAQSRERSVVLAVLSTKYAPLLICSAISSTDADTTPASIRATLPTERLTFFALSDNLLLRKKSSNSRSLCGCDVPASRTKMLSAYGVKPHWSRATKIEKVVASKTHLARFSGKSFESIDHQPSHRFQ